jgi:thiol-disulfide isomerase/thioredoxin
MSKVSKKVDKKVVSKKVDKFIDRTGLISLTMTFLPNLLLSILLLTSCPLTQPYTYEPPGRDPISIDKIRSSEKSVQLTTDNFDELTAGKLVFVKFYAPYCPHCNNMARAWNELAEFYAEKEDVVIGSIDCTDSPEGKNLCIRFKITGMPTLLYGPTDFDGAYLEEYGGDKSFEELKSFAAKELVPKCLPGSLDACAAEERAEMESYISMSYTELNGNIQSLEKQIKDARREFNVKKDEMQKVHDQKLLEKNLKVSRSKEQIKMINGVKEKLAAERVKAEL